MSCLITCCTSDCQREGITAWDCVDREEVLVIPAVLALLGDNPMQSELASHIGLTARMFCRICWVSGGRTDENDESDNDDDERPEAEPPDSMDVEEEDLDRQSVRPPSSAGRSATSGAGGKGPRGKVLETVEEMIDRAKRFLKVRRWNVSLTHKNQPTDTNHRKGSPVIETSQYISSERFSESQSLRVAPPRLKP